MNRLTNLRHYKKGYVKAFYARYGKESGLNPGVLWPRKEELAHREQYDKTFDYNLEDLIAKNEEKKAITRAARIDREQQIYDRLQQLPQELDNFFAKLEAKKQEREEWLRNKENLIEEVREILGYNAKPDDERFQEALKKKEEDEEKARKKVSKVKRLNSSLQEMIDSTSKQN